MILSARPMLYPPIYFMHTLGLLSCLHVCKTFAALSSCFPGCTTGLHAGALHSSLTVPCLLPYTLHL